MVQTTEWKRSKLYAGFVGVVALGLMTACADGPAQEEDPVDPGMEQQDPMQEDPMQDNPAPEEPLQEDPAEDSMTDDTENDGAEIEGAVHQDVTSLLGISGTTSSWSL